MSVDRRDFPEHFARMGFPSTVIPELAAAAGALLELLNPQALADALREDDPTLYEEIAKGAREAEHLEPPATAEMAERASRKLVADGSVMGRVGALRVLEVLDALGFTYHGLSEDEEGTS